MLLYIKLFLAVSLTGTIPFCVYLLFKKRLETRISATFQYRLLKYCLLCFIFPFSLVKSLFMSKVVAPDLRVTLNEYVYLDNTIVNTTNGFVLLPKGQLYKIFLPVWLIILVCLVSYQLYRYFDYRRKVIHHLEANIINQNQFTALKEELRLRRPVSLLYSNVATSPYTYGILHPCVVITSIVPKNAVPMVIRHELQHIKSHDFLFRFAAFFAILLHFWNPFIYLLWREICEVQELSCDEKITANLSPNEVHEYGYSLISITAAIQQRSYFSTGLSQNSKKSIHRRITYLSKRFDKKNLAPSVFLLLAIMIGVCVPVAACSPEVIYYKTDEDLSNIDWIYTEWESFDSQAFPEDEIHFQYIDQYYILDDGTIIDSTFDNSSSIKEKAACAHSWKKATLKSHERKGKGCSVFSYSVDLCQKCGSEENKNYLSEMKYAACSH